MLNIINKFFKGHQRTVKAKKNIVASIFIKGFNMLIGFMMVSITFNYLDETKYGIWVTLASIIGWISFFEVGLGGGLKNRLALAIANKDDELGKTYVSTTYAILSVIIIIVGGGFLFANTFIDWTKVLNTDASYADELSILVLIVFNFFFLQFVLKLIGIILKADQRPALADSFQTIGKTIALIIIYILIKSTMETNIDGSSVNSEGSLIYLGWVLSAAPVFVLLIATIYFFRTDYKNITPSIHYVKFKYAKDLLNLGLKFFFIQISMIVILQSSNIIIAQFYGPAEVTPYNIAYKLFSIVIVAFTIVASPFQVAFTEAWVKEDIVWVRKTIKNLFLLWIGLVLLALFLYVTSDMIFDFWLGEKMKNVLITDKLKISLLLYFLLFSLGGVFNMFINGVAKVSVQMYCHIIGAIIFIPIAYYLIKYLKWGIESVVIAGIFANFYYPIIAPIQYYKILNKKAKGIWNK